MTTEELLTLCDQSEQRTAQYGNLADAMLVLVIPGLRRGANAQLAPGLRGRVVGHGVNETMVWVTTTKIRAWLKRRGVE